MKSNSLMLSGEHAAKLGECKMGESKEITLTIMPTKMGDGEFHATITGVGYESKEKEEPAPKKKAKRAKALDMAIGGDY